MREHRKLFYREDDMKKMDVISLVVFTILGMGVYCYMDTMLASQRVQS